MISVVQSSKYPERCPKKVDLDLDHDLALLISFSVYDQVKHTPAKLRKTTYVVNEEDPVQSTTCAVMWYYY